MKKIVGFGLSLALALCLFAASFPVSAAQADPFTDLPAQPWYYDYLHRAADLGLFKGTSPTTFSPERALSRGEALVVLARLHEARTGTEIPAKSAPVFQDVLPDSEAGRAIGWAAENQLVSGCGGGRFAPGDSISRAELAVLFHKYLQWTGRDTLYPPDAEKYTDRERIPSWARPHAEAISGFELFRGDQFSPQAAVSRGEAAALFVRLYEKASYPIDTETPRQLYAYSLSHNENGELIPFLPLGPEHWRILSSYEEYQALMAVLQGAENFLQGELAPSLSITPSSFANHAVLAVEVQETGAAFDCALGELRAENGHATVTLVERRLGGYTADGGGIVYFVLVPAGTRSAQIQRLYWTEDTDWTPA